MKNVLSRISDQALLRIAPWVALAPIPAWFFAASVFAEPSAWRAIYRSNVGSAAIAEVYGRQMSHNWAGKFSEPWPGEPGAAGFVAEFDACFSAEREVQVPLMLTVDGKAELLVDGERHLTSKSEASKRGVQGKVLALSPGVHHVLVRLEAKKRASVGLLASWDDRAPTAIGSGKVAPGVRVFRPAAGGAPCEGRQNSSR